jgi:hypothetical protein
MRPRHSAPAGELRSLALRPWLALCATIPLLATPACAEDHASPPGLRPTEVDVTSDTTLRWGEPEIAINPKNPNNLVYAAVGIGFTNACIEAAVADPSSPCALVKTVYGQQPQGLMNDVQGFSVVSVWVTFDRGKTWKRALNVPGQLTIFPPSHQGAAESGDPLVTAGPDGTFYLGWDAIHFANLPTTIVDQGGIAVSKSMDGGLTWSSPVLTGTTIDRPFFATDLSTGTIYEASTGQVPGPLASGDPATPAEGPLDRHLVSSKDGVHWLKPHAFGGGGLGTFMSAANGVLATAFLTSSANNALCGKAATACTIFQTTKNSGANWTRHVLPAPNAYKGQPLVAADPAKPGRFAIGLLMANSTRFVISVTNDGGATWGKPAVVSDDIRKSHYHAWMAYSPKGILGLMWKTSDAASEGEPTAPYTVWAATSDNGGHTFNLPLEVSHAPSPAPDSRPFGNSGDDFSFIALGKTDAFVAWADWRPAERSGFFSAIKLPAFKH